MAPDTVLVQDALAIVREQSEPFSASLSNDFYKPIKKWVKTMEVLKKSVTVEGKAIYNLETLFSRLLVVGQQRNIEVANILQFELSPVPPALVDEYGCLRKGNKAVLVKSLGIFATALSAPDVVLVDAGQLLFHVVWPVAGITRDLAESFGAHLAQYHPDSKKMVVFD